MKLNKDLTKNYSKEDILSVLSNVKRAEKAIRAWKVIAGKKVFIDLKISIVRKNNLVFVVKGITETSKQFIKSMHFGVNRMFFYLPDDLIMFEAEIKESRIEDCFEVLFPKMIVHVEKRNNPRLFLDDGVEASVNFYKNGVSTSGHKQLFDKKCFDLSGGGLSFIISRTEARLFKKNDQIKNLKVSFGQQDFVVDAKVVGVFEIEPSTKNKLNYKGFKVCLAFCGINAEIEEKIDQFVFKYAGVAI